MERELFLCLPYVPNVARENKNDHHNNNNKSDQADDDSDLLGRTILAEKMKFLRVFLPFSHFLLFFGSSLTLLAEQLSYQILADCLLIVCALWLRT